MKTVYITEEQKKKLKKAIAAQDQVGGKVNAGVMDAVVGGMCEDVEDDKFVLGAEMNAPIGGIYYHVKEGKLNESPDYVDFFDVRFRNSNAYPFIYLWDAKELYIGQVGQKHDDIVKDVHPELYEGFIAAPYYEYCDEMLTGRYWQQYNVISFWKTPINKRMNVRKVVDALKERGIIQSSEYTVLDYWDNDSMSNCIIPIKWLFNGTYDMFDGRCSRIAPIKPFEYEKTGKYSYFQVTTNNSGIQCVNVSGDEILTGMEYYMKSSSMNEGVEDRNRMVDIRRIIQTDNFKRWFGNSKVVDKNGFPIIVHHGSPKFEGDSFKKDKNGKSLNYGEQGVFCTTQDMSWAKRFSYPISPGSTSFTVKVDYSKPGDILSGFLKIEHPLDFFHLTDKDWENIKDIILNGYMAKTMSDEKFEELKYSVLTKNHQFLKHMISGYNKDNDFGSVLKKYGYDGYIALMDMKDTAIEYCFFEPNQFKSIYSLAFNPESDSIYEGRNKVVKNDKGEIVPEKCDKCGGKVVLQIHGEPVYVCKDCGKYFGTMPFTLKESIDYEKWLEQLKQRRDPDNIEENIENEISPEDVDLSSFNIKRKLNPKFWVDGHLDSRIRLKLMDISDDFIEYLGIDPHIVKDILMTGSLANFNWSEEFSDIDLHVLLDYSDVDENTEFVKQYFMSQKNSWNNEHGDIKIFGFPVEVYVQDVNEKHDSSGVYSLDKDKWLVEPDRDVLATSKVNKAFIKDKVSDYTNKIDKLVYLYEKAKDDEYKLGKIAEKANVLWDEIKNSRKKGFEISNGKEINNFNIIFKTLRRFDYLDKLYQLKTKTYNKLNSIYEK